MKLKLLLVLIALKYSLSFLTHELLANTIRFKSFDKITLVKNNQTAGGKALIKARSESSNKIYSVSLINVNDKNARGCLERSISAHIEVSNYRTYPQLEELQINNLTEIIPAITGSKKEILKIALNEHATKTNSVLPLIYHDCYEKNGETHFLLFFPETEIKSLNYFLGNGQLSCKNIWELAVKTLESLKDLHNTGKIFGYWSNENILVEYKEEEVNGEKPKIVVTNVKFARVSPNKEKKGCFSGSNKNKNREENFDLKSFVALVTELFKNQKEIEESYKNTIILYLQAFLDSENFLKSNDILSFIKLLKDKEEKNNFCHMRTNQTIAVDLSGPNQSSVVI